MSEPTNEPTLKDILKELKEMNNKFDYFEKKFDYFEKKFDYFEKKFDYLESEIKTIKLTQNYVRETTSIGLEKPLDSISLASFLSDEKEENSYFKLFR